MKIYVYPNYDNLNRESGKSTYNPYTCMLTRAVAVLYMGICSSAFRFIHPMYNDACDSTLVEIDQFIENLTDSQSTEKLVLSSIVDYIRFMKPKSKHRDNVIFTTRPTIDPYLTLKSQVLPTDGHHALTTEFISSIICTIAGTPYIGDGVHTSWYIHDGNFCLTLHNKGKGFDNTDQLEKIARQLDERAGFCFWEYIGSFNLYNYTFDRLINFISRFSIPTVNYGDSHILFAEYCYRSYREISNKLFVEREARSTFPFRRFDESHHVVDITKFHILLKDLIKTSKNLNLEQSYFLPKMHRGMSLSIEAVNYLIKKKRTVNDYNAFAHSVLKDYVKQSSDNISLEAFGDDIETDIDDEDFTDEVNDDENENTDNKSKETSEDTDVDESEETDDVDLDTDTGTDTEGDEKSILESPNLLNIELVEEDTLEDMLYKEHICSLVKSYKENPPDNLSQEELLLLNEWVVYWIFLVSAETTKQLMKELSITVSDT